MIHRFVLQPFELKYFTIHDLGNRSGQDIDHDHDLDNEFDDGHDCGID